MNIAKSHIKSEQYFKAGDTVQSIRKKKCNRIDLYNRGFIISINMKISKNSLKGIQHIEVFISNNKGWQICSLYPKFRPIKRCRIVLIEKKTSHNLGEKYKKI